jgi:DNA-binding transcriptional LysR family regulator
MDRLDLLQMFARIIETGSLSAVAREQRLTQSAVSKRLQLLEREFGTRLLQRNTQGVRPTEAGRRLYAQGRGVLDGFDALRSGLLVGDALTGQVTLSVPMSFGEHLLARLLVGFHALHPQVQLDVSLTDRVVDLVEDGIDLAIRIGTVRTPDVVARRLATLHSVLVASPAYLKAHGTPKRAQDLAQHVFLNTSNDDEYELLEGGAVVRFRPRSWMRLRHSGAVKEALACSVGLSSLGRYLVHRELERGTLVEVLPGVVEPPLRVSAVYLGARAAPERVRALVSYLEGVLPEQPGLSLP